MAVAAPLAQAPDPARQRLLALTDRKSKLQ